MTGRLSRTARRRSPLPSNWPQLKRQVFARDGHHCQYHQLPGGHPCPSAHRLELHHLGADDDHRDHMLLTLCHRHHATITGRNARAIQLRGRRADPRPHPGLRLPGADASANASEENRENLRENPRKGVDR